MGIIKQKEVQAQEKDQINLYTIKQKDVQVQEKDQKRIRKSDTTTPLRLEETRTQSEAHNERENEKECTEIQDSKTEKQQNGTYMKKIFSWLTWVFWKSRSFIARLLSFPEIDKKITDLAESMNRNLAIEIITFIFLVFLTGFATFYTMVLLNINYVVVYHGFATSYTMILPSR